MLQFFRFICWIPKKIAQKLWALHLFNVEQIDEGGAETILMCLLITLISAIVGLVTFLILLVSGVLDKSDTPILTMGISACVGATYFAILFVHHIWQVFLAEQNELFNTLRKNHE